MLSLTGSILRGLLRLRKAVIKWDMSVETLRTTQAWSDRVIRPPRTIEIKPALTAGVTAEWVIPRGSTVHGVIFYVHGGGWTLGLHNLERRMLARVCRAAAVPALALHYRLAPEQPFPAALEDCVASYRWLAQRQTSPRSIVVVVTSAGGNLALATLMSLRNAGDRLPAAAVCISPVTDLACTGESFTMDNDPAVAAAFARSMVRSYVGRDDVRLPLLSPYYGDWRGLPPLLIQVGGDEIVLSDAIRFRDAASRSGVATTLEIQPHMWHGWHLFAPYLPEARQALDGIVSFVREHLEAGLD
jgi:acetyl esterase/lipase